MTMKHFLPTATPSCKPLVVLSVVCGLALAPCVEAKAAPFRTSITAMDLVTDGGAEGAEVEDQALTEPTVEPEGPAPMAYEPEPEPRKGLGLMITGSVITGVIGLPFTILGTAVIVSNNRPSEDDDHHPFTGAMIGGAALTVGLVGLHVGVPLLGVGASRFSRWRKWKSANTMKISAGLARTNFGTPTPTLTFRF